MKKTAKMTDIKLTFLKVSANKMGAWATYKFLGGSMDVYLRNNVPCKSIWGYLFVSCYIKPTGSNEDIDAERYTFESYSEFRKFRKNFMSLFTSKTN